LLRVFLNTLNVAIIIVTRDFTIDLSECARGLFSWYFKLQVGWLRARVRHFAGEKGVCNAKYSIGKTADGYALVKAPRGRRRRRRRRRQPAKVDTVSLTRRSLVEWEEEVLPSACVNIRGTGRSSIILESREPATHEIMYREIRPQLRRNYTGGFLTNYYFLQEFLGISDAELIHYLGWYIHRRANTKRCKWEILGNHFESFVCPKDTLTV